MKKISAFGLVVMILLSVTACGAVEEEPEWSESYAITGTENTQMWDLKADGFLSSINSIITDDSMKLEYLKEWNPTSSNCMLTKNGESWKILLDVFSESEANTSWMRKNTGAEEWVGNIESVELSLFAQDELEAEENGLYVRYLISIFTPGAEKLVEDSIGLYGEPTPDAVVIEGVNRVTVGNVAYSYTSDGHFIVEPFVTDWEAESATPAAIRPE